MYNAHARAKDAYGKIEKIVEVRVDAPGVRSLPDNASSHLRLENGELICPRSIAKEPMEQLIKDLKTGDPLQAALEKVKMRYKEKAFATLKTWALKAPSMLQSQGLLQTAAVLQEKFIREEDDGKNVYWLLSKWLLDNVPWPDRVINNDLMNTLNAVDDQEVFRFAHREAIAYMIWIKRAVSVNLAGVGQGE
ncbi:MAG: type III-B CRISPR module-associated protein Cmr5 [Deltaproteobacteria bacterium]|nr:type III-B CRISPR module-associated protein Cmr5 [Deltaproteobacteria bacterium]